MRRIIIPAALAMAAVITAPTASADEPSTTVVAYAATFGGIVCDVLDDHASLGGVQGVIQGVQADGFTAYEAGQIVGLSVAEICPRHTALILRFANAYGGRQIA